MNKIRSSSIKTVDIIAAFFTSVDFFEAANKKPSSMPENGSRSTWRLSLVGSMLSWLELAVWVLGVWAAMAYVTRQNSR
jgi:hypothetical protein